MTRKVFSLVFIFFCCGSAENLNNNSTVLQSGIEMNESSTSTSTTTFAPFSTTFTQTITIPTTTTSTTVYIAIQPPETPVTTASGPIPTLSTTTTVPQTTIDVVVTVGLGGSGQSVYLLNGSQNTILNVVSGNKYRFDQSDSSNSNHPLRFSESQEGSEYSTNVTSSGVPGNSGSYVEIEITSNTPNKLYLICLNHFGMGGNSEIIKN
tara:strand:- start:763 stop:1386 length:624 start_codon:yes stop_codon:yes gene_type:complete